MSNEIGFRIAVGSAFVALAFAGAHAENAPPTASRQSAVDLTVSEAQAIAGFESRVKDYVARHRKLETTLPRLPKRATPEQIHENQRALGVLIQTARAGAKRGEFFTPELQPVLKRTFAAVLAGPDGEHIKASIMEENPGVPSLSVNDRHPDALPLSTMPPQVLKPLPKLEEDLEYRFIGERLVLMDAHAHIVIDFTDDVLP